jgi:hypothetical protein
MRRGLLIAGLVLGLLLLAGVGVIRSALSLPFERSTAR